MGTISKRETTGLKIEMASTAIRQENDWRYKQNEMRDKLIKKGKSAPDALPLLKPAFVHIARKTPKQMPLYTTGMDTVIRSNKYLCGHLGALCKVLKGAGLPYPWLEENA